jgi:hypothetical protein
VAYRSGEPAEHRAIGSGKNDRATQGPRNDAAESTNDYQGYQAIGIKHHFAGRDDDHK